MVLDIIIIIIITPTKKKSVLHPQTYPSSLIHKFTQLLLLVVVGTRSGGGGSVVGWLVGCSVLVTCGKRGKAREPKPAGSFC